MEDRIKQLENQVAMLTNKITQLENDQKQTASTFTVLKTNHNTMEQNILAINSRQDRYDDITKKKYHLHFNKQKRSSADDSETNPAMNEDMSCHDQGTLTDNTVYEGIIEPDSDSRVHNIEASTFAFGSFNIFSGLSSHK
ncbi:hypothetical protein RhiirA5_434670 [Rhizophagus irregularis]|uniref:Uncharacterized protein n=1 Tax=Rhizophagus irregularis TaxID=588596 RepID=A0A2N0NPN7_9GLOM|nr:hypothetical protein RhiirA5_434670 [Rhizophagus irregularis]